MAGEACGSWLPWRGSWLGDHYEPSYRPYWFLDIQPRDLDPSDRWFSLLIRTPVVALYLALNARAQNYCGRQTGVMLCLFPRSWSLHYDRGEPLYRYWWSWMRTKADFAT